MTAHDSLLSLLEFKQHQCILVNILPVLVNLSPTNSP